MRLCVPGSGCGTRSRAGSPGNSCSGLRARLIPREGPAVRIPLPPPASLSRQCPAAQPAQNPAPWRRSARGWGRDKGRAGREPVLLGSFSLSGIDAVPPRESAAVLQRHAGRSRDHGPRHLCLGLRLSCQQSALLGPVERQIEFGQPRRGELDGLPALLDGFDQLRAQEGEANETSDVAPGDAVALGQLLE